MPDQIRSGSPEINRVDASAFQKISTRGKALLSRCATASSNLAVQLKGAAANNFHKLVGFLAHACSNPMALEGMKSIERLERMVARKPWSQKGHVNLNFIEHLCGLRNEAEKHSPNFYVRSSEGKTQFLAPYRDFMLDVIDSEKSLFDSMLDDVAQHGVAIGLESQTCAAMRELSAVLQGCGSLMSTISRHRLLDQQKNDPSALSNASDNCLREVKNLLPGQKMIIPLGFYSYGKKNSSAYSGHAAYLVVEKNHDQTVNMHMVNRGAGSRVHQRHPYQEHTSSKPLKRESAVSKWNVPVDQTGGFSRNFMMKTLLLTLDAKVDADGTLKATANENPSAKMRSNISQFYHLLGQRTGSEPPSDREPIYQRGQKDGNCAYSNLKASLRYVLNDQKMYNLIDLAKIEKVSSLTTGYMQGRLQKSPILHANSLNRSGFDAINAVDTLLKKHERAELRVNMDRGAALPLILPPHLRNVTN